jgi:tetratricopeptide (TPR) repeat protein
VAAPPEPLDVDDAIAVRDKVRVLVEESQWQQAIDLLDDAVARAYHDPALELELSLDLATTLYEADEFGRAAPLLDRVLPQLLRRDGPADPAVIHLRYAAGVSHAEAGDPAAALAHLTAYLEHADPTDRLNRDARYQRGLMLCANGRTAEGIAELEALRPLYVAEYGADSVHARALDRRIDQLRRHSESDRPART